MQQPEISIHPLIGRLPYITLMAQNCKVFLIIFLQKNTHKNCVFSIVLHTVFMRFSVLSGKTKSAKAEVFCGDFHII